MSHWSEQYIGLEYQLGILDCAKLLTKVRKEVFKLPVPDDLDVQRSHSRIGRVGQMSDLVNAYGVPTENPKDGDAVLMICAGRPSHIGVFCIVNNEKSVLHAMENAGMVVLHKLRELDRYFLKIEGYYAWK